MAIKRMWHGWTTRENADIYEHLLRHEIFPGIAAKNLPGYRSIELWRRDLGNESEFITVMTFDALQNVIDFQGTDYQRAYVPEAAQQVLTRWDHTSEHYEVKETLVYES